VSFLLLSYVLTWNGFYHIQKFALLPDPLTGDNPSWWAMLLLCWWHVLHVWQQHFITTSFPELWDVLKSWIRITDETKFNKSWAKVQESFTEYIITYWLLVWDM